MKTFPADCDSEIYRLPDGGWCPNNPTLPLLIYRRVLSDSPEMLAELFEETFAENGWPPAWRYTIYDFAHYHSTTHEVIGVYRGTATVRFGDAVGFTAQCGPGDVLLIPAGVSHQRLAGSDDFHGVGAYPDGCEPDILVGKPMERPAADRRIAALPVPPQDPIFGPRGPMAREWHHRPEAGQSV